MALFTLHNWERDYPSFNILESRIPPNPEPLWEFTAPHSAAFFATQYPSIIHNSIKMVLPTRRVLYGLTIQMDDYSLDGVQLVPLIKAPFGNRVLAAHALQLNRAIGCFKLAWCGSNLYMYQKPHAHPVPRLVAL